MIKKKDYKLGEALIKKGLVTLDHVTEALKIQEKTSVSLGKILVHLAYVDEENLLLVLSEQFSIPYLNLKDIKIQHEAIKKMPANLAFHYRVLPIIYDGNKLTLLVSDPLDARLYDELQTLVGHPIEIALGHEQQIIEALEEQYGLGADTLERMGLQDKLADFTSKNRTEVIDIKSDDGSIVKLVNQLLLDAYKARATDIHLEPYDDEFRARYRVDGILYDAKLPSTVKQYQNSIISRIKVMANLDISEKRLPQDGRIKIKTGNEELDLRVSIVPTSFGEAAVIRILSSTHFLDLKKVGFGTENLLIIKNILKNPYGIIFLTGPTGSGKTTTLYACLNEINDNQRKIVTIEDPIEYQLKGIIQIQVHTKIGLTFSQGLRHLLRHDPDVMMVGEVRDLETAEIAIRTALTGHLVFSTLHTTDAPGAVARLIDMGVEPYLAGSSILCAIAQRLVRVLCPSCKTEVDPSQIEFKIPERFRTAKFFEGKGCVSCKKTGYHGRTAIHEIMIFDDEVKHMVAKKVTTAELRRLAASKNMKSLLDDGLEKASKGITSISEVLRVAQQGELET